MTGLIISPSIPVRQSVAGACEVVPVLSAFTSLAVLIQFCRLFPMRVRNELPSIGCQKQIMAQPNLFGIWKALQLCNCGLLISFKSPPPLRVSAGIRAVLRFECFELIRRLQRDPKRLRPSEIEEILHLNVFAATVPGIALINRLRSLLSVNSGRSQQKAENNG